MGLKRILGLYEPGKFKTLNSLKGMELWPLNIARGKVGQLGAGPGSYEPG